MAQQTDISKKETTQTAVEWFAEVTAQLGYVSFNAFEQAKQMEKEQLINTYLDACKALTPYGYYKNSAEQYYNETYEI